MKVQLTRVQWGRVLLASGLVVIATIFLNYVVFLLVLIIWGQTKHIPDVFLNGICSSSVLIIVLTLVSALWVARTVQGQPRLHGLLVGLITAFLLFLITSGFRGEFVFLAVITTILTIEAGWFGGFLGSRRRQKSESSSFPPRHQNEQHVP
jgi:hypothetical protein